VVILCVGKTIKLGVATLEEMMSDYLVMLGMKKSKISQISQLYSKFKIYFFFTLFVSLLGILTIRVEAAVITFSGEELLGRPTANSITINVVPDANIELYYEYGIASGSYSAQTPTTSANASQSHETVIDGLTSNTQYFYRMQYRTPSADWVARPEHSFWTQRDRGESFVFTIISDSHLGHLGSASRYEKATENVAADHPDFHLDLGDAFVTNNLTTQSAVNTKYLNQRPYFENFSHSTPVFLAIGNHENEEGWNFDDTFSLALASIKARKSYYPTPVTDGIYTGNTDTLAAIGGDQLREDYYAWEWGDALFVVIDPFQYTMTNPYGAIAGEGSDDSASGDQWNWTLGLEQFNWLKQTLENSTAKYKFVFSHHVTGGQLSVSGAAGTPGYVRGGANAVPYFEWGGQNADSTWGFTSKRPAFGDDPIHQIMVANHVSAYFHGHDHQYAYEVRDGIVYHSIPAPGMTGSGFNLYSESDPYTIEVLPNSGHIRVTVSPEVTTVEYVRSDDSVPANNGVVSYTYTIDPGPGESTYDLTLSVDPTEGGTTDPTLGTHAFSVDQVVTITALPAEGYEFDHWTGEVTNPNSATTTVTMDADKSVTAHFIQTSACINLNVAAGWNLTSVPVVAADMTLSYLFPEVTSPAYEYTGAYQEVNGGDSLIPGKGYWTYFNDAHTYQVCGAIVTSRDISVTTGWNMIGPFEQSVALGSISSTPSDILDPTLYGYQESYVEATALEPGQGYWAYVTADGTLHLGTSESDLIVDHGTTNEACILNYQVSINVMDAGSGSQILVIGQGPSANDDLNTFCNETHTPPKPPAGAFDARLILPNKLDASFRDIRSSLNSSVSWRMEFQPGIGGYPFSFSWDSALLPAGSWRLQDILGGVVIDIDMTAQEDYLLEGSNHNALLIRYTADQLKIPVYLPLVRR